MAGTNTNLALSQKKLKDANDALYKAKHAVPQNQDEIKKAQDVVNQAQHEVKKAQEALTTDRNNSTNNATHFSDSFRRDIAATFQGRPTGNTLDVAAAGSDAEAQNLRNEAATHQMEAQRSQQIANQNPFSEAGKVASFQNDAENRQRVNNQSFSAGTASARLRETNTPNVQDQYAREDAQQNIANQRRDEESAATQDATTQDEMAETYRVKSRDYDADYNTTGYLSRGEGGSEDADDSGEEDPKEEPKTMPSGDAQHVINALLGHKRGADLRNNTATADVELFKWAVEHGGVMEDPNTYNTNDSNKWEGIYLQRHPNLKGLIQTLRQGRAGAGKDASKNFVRDSNDNLVGASTSMTAPEDASGSTTGNSPKKGPPSDVRIKNLKAQLSDLRMKHIREDFDNEGICSREDYNWLLSRAGKYKHDDEKEYDAFNDEDFGDAPDETVLDGYANFIKNFVYTYKPEATEIDSSIDPNEEHIGPMAQDIEKVNPACIKETKDGIKTVDTSRLSLMNAGAIGDLARQLNELNEKFKALGL